MDFELTYDLSLECDDPKYSVWLKEYHPELPLLDEPLLTPDSAMLHSNFGENLQRLEEKEIEKQRKIGLKEERAKLRQEKSCQKRCKFILLPYC